MVSHVYELVGIRNQVVQSDVVCDSSNLNTFAFFALLTQSPHYHIVDYLAR